MELTIIIIIVLAIQIIIFGVTTSILRNGNYLSILIKHANSSWGVISKVPPAYSEFIFEVTSIRGNGINTLNLGEVSS
jgi:hypothetical protein